MPAAVDAAADDEHVAAWRLPPASTRAPAARSAALGMLQGRLRRSTLDVCLSSLCFRFGSKSYAFAFVWPQGNSPIAHFGSPSFSLARDDSEPPPVRAARRRARARRGDGRGAGRALRRDAADRAARREAAGRGRRCSRAFTAACACRARPPRTSPTASASSSTRAPSSASRGRWRRRCRDGCSLIINIGTTTEAIARGAAASPGPARHHQQPERRGDPVGQRRLRGDRRRRRRARARPRHRRRGDGRLHPPVQGRHRADRHLGHRGRRHAARLRLPRGEGRARRSSSTRARCGWRPTTASSTARRWSRWRGSTRSTRCSPTSRRPRRSRALLAEAGVTAIVA